MCTVLTEGTRNEHVCVTLSNVWSINCSSSILSLFEDVRLPMDWMWIFTLQSQQSMWLVNSTSKSHQTHIIVTDTKTNSGDYHGHYGLSGSMTKSNILLRRQPYNCTCGIPIKNCEMHHCALLLLSKRWLVVTTLTYWFMQIYLYTVNTLQLHIWQVFCKFIKYCNFLIIVTINNHLSK